MMPLSFAALISGMMTLVATAPNLVVNSELERMACQAFGFFSFTPFGLPVLVLGVIYMIFARRWLSVGNRAEGAERGRASPTGSRSTSLPTANTACALRGSPLVGKTLEELNLRSSAGANILAIERTRRFALKS